MPTAVLLGLIVTTPLSICYNGGGYLRERARNSDLPSSVEVCNLGMIQFVS